MKKSADSPIDAASALPKLLVRSAVAILPIKRRKWRNDATRKRHREHPPLVHFHLDLLETGRANQLIHLRRGSPSHDPGLPFPIPEDARDEFHLRMPGLIRVDQVTARLDRVGQAAQRFQHTCVLRKELE